jgi:hypothetical protein
MILYIAFAVVFGVMLVVGFIKATKYEYGDSGAWAVTWWIGAVGLITVLLQAVIQRCSY